MSERETFTYTAQKSNIAVVIKTEPTGREKRVVNRLLTKEVTVDKTKLEEAAKLSEENANVELAAELVGQSLSIESLEEYRDEMVRQMVVSVDGKTDNVLDALLDLPASDYDDVVEKIGTAFRNEEFDEKKAQ